MAAVKTNFKLSQRYGEATVREHLELEEKLTGIRPKELDEGEIPNEYRHVWIWFLELHAARTSNGFCSNPIAYSEILGWSQLTGNILRNHEIEALRAIDNAYIEYEMKKSAKLKKNENNKSPKHNRPN